MAKPDREPLHAYLARIRATKGLTLRQAGEKTGLSFISIRAIERGEQLPRVPTLRKLAAGYGVSFSDLASRIT